MSVLNFTHFTGAVARCKKYGLVASEGILFFVPDRNTALRPYDPFEDVDGLLLDVVKAGAEVANCTPFLDYCMAHKMLLLQDIDFWRHGDFFAVRPKEAQPLIDTLLTFIGRYGLPSWDGPVMTYYPAKYDEQMMALKHEENDDTAYLTVYEGAKRVYRKSGAVPVCTVALTLLNFYLQWIAGLNGEAFFIRNTDWMMYQGKEKAPRLTAQVHDLKECIHLAYALASSGEGKTVRQCKNCGKFFISTDWRSEYCSPNCRGAYNSKMTRKRVKERRLHGEQ